MSPPVAVRNRLADCRAAGVEFAEAWRLALGEAPAGWRDALTATRGSWAAAYERRQVGGPLLLAVIETFRAAAAEDDGAAGSRRRARLVA